MRVFALTLFLFWVPACAEAQAGGVAAAGISKFDRTSAHAFNLFMQVCVHNLHDPKQAKYIMDQAGWSRQSLSSFNDGGLFANVILHGLKDLEGEFYLSQDRKSGFLFGPADNDLNPNSKCMLSTTLSDAEPFAEWADKAFDGQIHSDQTGKRYGNRRRNWRSAAFPENVSVDFPVADVILGSGLLAAGTTEADTQISVTGLTP